MKKIVGFLMVLLVGSGLLQKANAQLSIGISISARIAPPPLPVYTQPIIPGDGYIWTPGYWAYDNVDGYYWVPGVWVMPPQPGLYWTPAYWGFANGIYGFHSGYWGPHVGFYGGINYGCGYFGSGYGGGMWVGRTFRYNTAVSNVNTTIVHNTYVNRTVINNVTVNNHNSFNGPGGVEARPSAQEAAYTNEHHYQPTQQQLSHQQNAGRDHNQFASVNHGAPSTVAMDRVNGRAYNQQGRVAAAAAANRQNATPDRNAQNRGANANRTERPGRVANANRPSNVQPNNNVNRQPNRPNNANFNNNRNANNPHAGGNPAMQQRRPQGAPMQNHQPNPNMNRGNERPNNGGGEGRHH